MTAKEVRAGYLIESGASNTRRASQLLRKANEFQSAVWLENTEGKFNAKSLLGILQAIKSSGGMIKISADGFDEDIAVEDLGYFIEHGLRAFERD